MILQEVGHEQPPIPTASGGRGVQGWFGMPRSHKLKVLVGGDRNDVRQMVGEYGGTHVLG